MDKEYKEIFSYNNDIRKNAYMNWRMAHWSGNKKELNIITMANAYSEASINLINQCLIDNNDKKADSLIFPIIFSINQSIELYLKSIMKSISILLGDEPNFKNGHDIYEIFKEVDLRVKEFEKDEYEKCIFKRDFKNIEEYIKEIDSKSIYQGRKNMDFPRYPQNIKGKDQFYVDTSDNVVVDLENLKNRIENILENLDDISWFYFQLAHNELY